MGNWEDIEETLAKKKGQLAVKRAADVALSLAGLAVLSPVLLVCAAAIKLDSPGPVFYRQVRVGRGGRAFRIFKLRTMTDGADRRGPEITVGGDARITRVGAVLRKYKLDELAQLINVLLGDMSFCGVYKNLERRAVQVNLPFEDGACFSASGIRETIVPAMLSTKTDSEELPVSGYTPRNLFRLSLIHI